MEEKLPFFFFFFGICISRVWNHILCCEANYLCSQELLASVALLRLIELKEDIENHICVPILHRRYTTNYTWVRRLHIERDALQHFR